MPRTLDPQDLRIALETLDALASRFTSDAPVIINDHGDRMNIAASLQFLKEHLAARYRIIAPEDHAHNDHDEHDYDDLITYLTNPF